MQRRNVLLFFAVLFLLPILSSAQEFPGQKKVLSGHIRDESTSRLLSDVRIDLQNSMGTPIGFAYSDGNGEYYFDDIGQGDCYAVAQLKGYVTTREFVRPDGSGHVYRDIFLRPEGAASASKTANPVTEHQLSVPRKAQESFEKGVQLVVEKSDYRGAVTQFQHAIEKYPSYYEAYAAMGLADSKLGDGDAAEAALKTSISLSAEKYPQAMIDLASIYIERKRFTDAEALLRKVVALDASSSKGEFELAVALRGQNKFKDAVASATAARDLKPDDPQIYLLLYNLHIQVNDFPAALADTDSYLKLSPTGPTADRVRHMQEEIRKGIQSPGTN